MKATKLITSPDGTQIAFDAAGQGPALMLLHGAGKTRKDWHTLGYVERLQKNFTVITVDIRGTGESDYLVEIEDYAIEKICQDLYAVADACGEKQFAILGFSFGGNIARYPAAWSERISAISIIGVPFGPAVDEAFEQYIINFEKKYAPLVEAQQQTLQGQKPERNPKKQRTPIKGQLAGWLACFRAMRDWPPVEANDLRAPAQLVVGTQNQNVMRWIDAHQGELRQADVELQMIADLTHNQEFIEINRVLPVITHFFAEQINNA